MYMLVSTLDLDYLPHESRNKGNNVYNCCLVLHKEKPLDNFRKFDDMRKFMF